MSAQTLYSKEIATEICEIVSSSNKSVATICQDMGLKPRTVWGWLAKVQEFQDMWVVAKEQQMDFLIEETIEIADEPSRDLIDAQDRKLRVNARQWAAGKLKSKVYGDNKNIAMDVKMKHVVSPEQFNQLLQAASSAAQIEDIEHEEV